LQPSSCKSISKPQYFLPKVRIFILRWLTVAQIMGKLAV
jgi:hypothetical protein